MTAMLPADPSVRCTHLVALRSAALELWGERALRNVADRMSEAARARCIDGPLEEEWYPETFVVEWCEAAWSGPCREDEREFFRLINRMTDHGFARTREVLLSLANPSMVLRRVGELWRAEHTTGTLTWAPLDVTTARITLKDHIYTLTPRPRAAIAECFRYTIALCHVSDVTATHAVGTGGALHVTLRWR